MRQTRKARNWTEWLKSRNRTLLEMHLGILFYGCVCQVIGGFLAERKIFYAGSLWFGIALSIVASVHMYRTLDRALDHDEKNAAKLIFKGYAFRYSILIIVFMTIGFLGCLSPLVVFLGYMSLKATVYLQPFTHKLCNHFFHETDPVAEPVTEEKIVEEFISSEK